MERNGERGRGEEAVSHTWDQSGGKEAGLSLVCFQGPLGPAHRVEHPQKCGPAQQYPRAHNKYQCTHKMAHMDTYNTCTRT